MRSEEHRRATLRATGKETKAMPGQVKTKATELDVYVAGVRVGSVTDCGDCWRASVLGRRKRRMYNRDFETRRQAVRAVVDVVTA